MRVIAMLLQFVAPFESAGETRFDLQAWPVRR
jgi:hypothetical protein